jgi:hypothetical protein
MAAQSSALLTGIVMKWFMADSIQPGRPPMSRHKPSSDEPGRFLERGLRDFLSLVLTSPWPIPEISCP